MNQTQPATATGIRESLHEIIQEIAALAEDTDFTGTDVLLNELQQARAVFLLAAGRSGFAMRSIAMRLMHLGFDAYYVGDTTTPAIRQGDLLWAASGSGTTASVVRGAEQAKKAGGRVAAITTNSTSPLAQIADAHLLLPAAAKQDHSGFKSKQYAGSLFEQTVLLLGDAIFMQLWKSGGAPAETLWARHANIE